MRRSQLSGESRPVGGSIVERNVLRADVDSYLAGYHAAETRAIRGFPCGNGGISLVGPCSFSIHPQSRIPGYLRVGQTIRFPLSLSVRRAGALLQ